MTADGSRDLTGAARLPVSALELRRIVDSGVVGIVVWDRSGQICDANDRFLEIVGYDRDDLDERRITWSRLTSGDWNSCGEGLIERLRSQGIARTVEHECLRRDGTRVVVKLHSTTFAEDYSRVLSVVIDVTGQKDAEEERDALVERERLARSEAEGAVRARDDILAIVSHDLRNPLNVIAMSATVLASTLPEEKKAAQLGIIRRAISGMNSLIDDLLDVSQIASERLKVQPQLVDAASICDDARLVLEPLMSQKAQHFECDISSRPLMVMADSGRVLQVLSNLIGNAHKFTPEGGRITVRIDAEAGSARFAIADTGPGISRQDLPHIFDRFWQARRVRRGGVGLGLAISKGIIDAHGGKIWAESCAGVGTTFYFTLPAAR